MTLYSWKSTKGASFSGWSPLVERPFWMLSAIFLFGRELDFGGNRRRTLFALSMYRPPTLRRWPRLPRPTSLQSPRFASILRPLSSWRSPVTKEQGLKSLQVGSLAAFLFLFRAAMASPVEPGKLGNIDVFGVSPGSIAEVERCFGKETREFGLASST